MHITPSNLSLFHNQHVLPFSSELNLFRWLHIYHGAKILNIRYGAAPLKGPTLIIYPTISFDSQLEHFYHWMDMKLQVKSTAVSHNNWSLLAVKPQSYKPVTIKNEEQAHTYISARNIHSISVTCTIGGRKPKDLTAVWKLLLLWFTPLTGSLHVTKTWWKDSWGVFWAIGYDKVDMMGPKQSWNT